MTLSLGLGRKTILIWTSILLYADDIMLHLCESELLDLDMSFNENKSVCMHFGLRFNAICAKLTALGGDLLARIGICRYLGVYCSRDRSFQCCFDNCKSSFYHSFIQFTVVLVVVLRLKQLYIYCHRNGCQSRCIRPAPVIQTPLIYAHLGTR